MKVKEHKGASSVVARWKTKMIIAAQQLHLVWIGWQHVHHPIRLFKAVRSIQSMAMHYLGGFKIRKIRKVGQRYYWDMYGASWPSATFREHIAAEFKRQLAPTATPRALRNVLLSVTTHCPLRCEHCFEWENLNKKEVIRVSDLRHIVRSFQDDGVCQILFSGGEPMLRLNDLLEVLRTARSGTDFWIATSGLNMTRQHAAKLKDAGLTGVVISLDDYREGRHNAFRNYRDAFYWAQEAANNAGAEDLVVALSLCATREFVSEKNLIAYAELALNWNASFIQLVHPQAVGHFQDKDVSLPHEQVEILTRFFKKLNNDPRYDDYPIVIYHEPYMKSMGCMGAGDRFVYVDPLANVHACPFCRTSCGNLLTDEKTVIDKTLSTHGCQKNRPVESTPVVVTDHSR